MNANFTERIDVMFWNKQKQKRRRMIRFLAALENDTPKRGENDMHINLYNSEHYACPTEYEALSNIEKEKKFNFEKDRRYEPKAPYVYRPIVYICSPYSGNIYENTKAAKRYSRFAVDCGCLPITPHLFFPQFMDDSDPEDRKLAFDLNYILLNKCSQIWVFGDYVSKGMEAEIRNAKRKNILIRHFNSNCEEVNR